jgi:AraC family L-rhamnose operon regulatory protein RhaS
MIFKKDEFNEAKLSGCSEQIIVNIHVVSVKINAVSMIRRFNSFYSLNVFSLELEKWEFEWHKHNFYELIFIEQGRGKHKMNDGSFNYKEGDVFLLTPDDAHSFEIAEKTIFTYVKFTEQVFLDQLKTKSVSQVQQALKTLLAGQKTFHGSIVSDNTDAKNIFRLVRIMKLEFEQNRLYGRELLLELFDPLIILLARNVNNGQGSAELHSETERLNDILGYIRMHALDNEKSRIKVIAASFAMSVNYISIYVKKHTGLSIQQHILQTRLKYAELLLKEKRYNINEIAVRLGFSDASHFNKIFKKYKKVSPGKY